MSTIKFRSKKNFILDITPTRIIVFSFVMLILIGTVLLSLPISSKNGIRVSPIDALFTATSASCVTGLIIADTKTQWSVFGQLVILFCIQVGGLGIVTLATFFSVLLGKKMGIQGMLLARESVNYFSYEGIRQLIKKIVFVTLIAEFIGTILLSLRLVPQFGIRGFYLAFFHSVSAFCNAGFDLFGNSLISYNKDPLFIFTISGLIIFGGLGFTVWKDMYEYQKKKNLLLHTKLVLIISSVLIVSGTILFYIFEQNNPSTMGPLPFYEKITASFFQSVTCRTAGFNSIHIEHLTEISKAISILLMFIGGAPGSTAGGIKVTTIGIILVAIISETRGSNKTILFANKISPHIIFKSIAILGLSAFLVIVVTFLLQFIEGKFQLLDVFFEAVSAFATVGLTSLGTPNIKFDISKLLLAFTMFLGRVGPLSFALSIALSSKKNANRIYPEGKVIVG